MVTSVQAGTQRVAVGGKPAENAASGRLWPGMGIHCSEGRHLYKCWWIKALDPINQGLPSPICSLQLCSDTKWYFPLFHFCFETLLPNLSPHLSTFRGQVFPMSEFRGKIKNLTIFLLPCSNPSSGFPYPSVQLKALAMACGLLHQTLSNLISHHCANIHYTPTKMTLLLFLEQNKHSTQSLICLPSPFLYLQHFPPDIWMAYLSIFLRFSVQHFFKFCLGKGLPW